MMSSNSLSLSTLSFFIIITSLLLSVVLSESEGNSSCSSTFVCGHFPAMRYPFRRNDQPHHCGHPGFNLDCQGHGGGVTIDIMGQKYRVIDINPDAQILKIARTDFLSTICPEKFDSITWDPQLFNLTPSDEIACMLYDCDPTGDQDHLQNKFSCPKENRRPDSYFILPTDPKYETLARSCKINILITVLKRSVDNFTHNSMKIEEVIREGFELRWIIKKGSNIKLKVIIGVSAALGGMAIMAACFLIYQHRKKIKYSSVAFFSRKYSSDPSSRSNLENGDSFPGVHVFSYSELEEATNYFDSARELGDGGFGTVYYGKLQDGRTVAVKRLYENNYKRVEQFMNEVEILAGLHHVNLVSLYGCTSRHSRELLLVYEFVPNGTVADHLHGERAKPGAMPWPTRLKIAIETASALTYLHASDIIHRDVKTNNILLDKHFCVKVADFGLSRLFPTHATHVSTAPQGTPGYVDPEYHQCYQLTERSDVFSFGVVLIELISSLAAVDITRHRHEINLSNLAINKIQNQALHELVDQTLGYESDYKVRKMINAVAELAFQCLHSEKELRPYMVDVLETLKDIQREGYNKKKTEEMLTESPNSVTQNWISTQTTPNPSS